MRLGLAIILWFAVVLLTIVNGHLGDTFVWPRYGGDFAQVYKTVGEVFIILFFSSIYAYGTRGDKWLVAALGVGITWLLLTIIFDFVLLFYDFGYRLDTLLLHYRFTSERLWPIILPTQLSGPLIMGLLCNVSK
jgi:hypothetical protein